MGVGSTAGAFSPAGCGAGVAAVTLAMPPSWNGYAVSPKGLAVEPEPGSDQGPAPSSLVARTCASYSVPGSRPPMEAAVAAALTGWSVQAEAPLAR